MLTVGLTGGIAAGKSLVARALGAHGAATMDADHLAHALTGPGGAAVPRVLAELGPELGTEAEGLDREALARLAFGSKTARSRLESILHPLIREAIAARRDELAREGRTRVLVVEAALLVEAGGAAAYDLLLVVEAPRETKRRRLLDERGLSAAEAGARLDAQLPAGRKLLAADLCLWNDGDEATLGARCDEIWEHLNARAGA